MTPLKQPDFHITPWLSLALLVLAGLGLVLRHDLLPVIGFDLGIASVLVGVAGLLMFSSRRDPALEEHDHISGPLLRPSIVVTLSLIIFAAYTFSAPLLALIIPTDTEKIEAPRHIAHMTPNGRAALVLRRQTNGLFTTQAKLNNQATRMRIDTGAETVVLNAEDARRAGLDLSALQYSVPLQTAHGTAFAAEATLAQVRIGPFATTNVRTLIVKPGKLETSILGMSFLKRLRTYKNGEELLVLEG